jgi:beta-galactosidase
MNWEIYKLPIDEKMIKALRPATQPEAPNSNGRFFKGNFTLTETGDTYFDLSGYSKGVVYINGHNLGRYWNLGPQYRLYCPASWLRKGDNEIVVFDLHQENPAQVAGVKTLE